jgi:hypothetical protein
MWHEALLVGAIVVVAAGYSAWALLPGAARLRIAQSAAAWGRRPGRPAWLGRITARIERVARAKVGGCSECSAVQDAPKPPGKHDGHENP